MPNDTGFDLNCVRSQAWTWRSAGRSSRPSGVLALLAGLPDRAGYDRDVFCSERVQAAIVLLANGDIGRLKQAIDLAATDWRDLLVAAMLKKADWPDQLDRVLGPPAR